MPLFINREPRLVEKIYAGDRQAFTSLYEKCRDEFFGYFGRKYSEKPYGNKRLISCDNGGAYLDDLYQNSCWKLYNQITTGKMFVDAGIIYIRKRDGSINKLTAS